MTAGNAAPVKRTLGGFALFAISFAFISVGVFATYGIVLQFRWAGGYSIMNRDVLDAEPGDASPGQPSFDRGGPQ